MVPYIELFGSQVYFCQVPWASNLLRLPGQAEGTETEDETGGAVQLLILVVALKGEDYPPGN